MQPQPFRVFISAAEQSADRHGASLIRTVLARRPGIRFVGVAGPRMVEAGCDALFDMSAHSAMLLGAVKAAGRAVKMLRQADECLRRFPFDAAVVIDSPTLHLPLAASAQAIGVPVLYYIAPQLWAWGSYRIHKVRNRVEKLAVILPFEEAYFRSQGVDAVYVGHPLAEQLDQFTPDEDAIAAIKNSGAPFVTLLPGSRKHVVESVLPGQLDVAARIQAVFPKAAFGVSVANSQVAPVISAMLAASPIRVGAYDRRYTELIRAADLVLVASGTTTLEVAFHGRPMIVMYQASRLFYHLVGRWMIQTPYLSLPNILAGREIVPEFMPYYTSTAPIAERAINLLRSEDDRRSMIRDLEDVVRPLRGTRASERTADLLLGMIDRSRH